MAKDKEMIIKMNDNSTDLMLLMMKKILRMVKLLMNMKIMALMKMMSKNKTMIKMRMTLTVEKMIVAINNKNNNIISFI